MKIVVDNRLQVREFGRAVPRPDSVRFYYTVVGYDCLVLVCYDDDYVSLRGQVRVALFNFDTVAGRIICEKFPGAPAAWREHEDLVQCTVRRMPRLPSGQPILLSDAVRQMVGPEC